MFVMILLLAGVAFTIMNIYIATRIFNWFRSFWPRINGFLFLAVYLIFPVFLLAGQKLPWCTATKVMKYIGTYWLGAFLYLTMFIVLTEVLLFLLKKTKVLSKDFMEQGKNRFNVGLGVIVCTVVVLVAGVWHFSDIQLADYQVKIQKETTISQLNITMFADIHLGASCSQEKIQQIVEMVNAQEPDLICIPGDIFDISVYTIEERNQIAHQLAKLDAKYGVYACLGNHDVSWYSEDPEEKAEFEAFFQQAGITLLNDDSVLIDDSFYLAGRIDKSPSGYGGEVERKTAQQITENMDTSKPILLLDHQPDQLHKEEEAGVDLVLSGHTHGGQIWPGTLLIKMTNENGWGQVQIEKMNSIVTSGVGVWGPPLRIGSDCEIVNVTVKFQ